MFSRFFFFEYFNKFFFFFKKFRVEKFYGIIQANYKNYYFRERNKKCKIKVINLTKFIMLSIFIDFFFN